MGVGGNGASVCSWIWCAMRGCPGRGACVAWGSAEASSPGDLSEMPVTRSHPALLMQELGGNPAICISPAVPTWDNICEPMRHNQAPKNSLGIRLSGILLCLHSGSDCFRTSCVLREVGNSGR